MSKSILEIDTPESCRECMIRNLADYCQAAEKRVEEYRENKNKPDWCPLIEESIKEHHSATYIAYLKRNGYIVKKFTESMKRDSEECERLECEGKMKDCSECECNVCLVQ